MSTTANRRGKRPFAATRWRLHAGVFLSYALLSLLLAYPLAGHFATHVPGDGGDDPALAWNLWWVPHALLREGQSPFLCDYMFYPLGINLAFYTLTVWNAFLSVPLQATAGLVPASNLLLLSSFALGAYGTYLLARHLLQGQGRSREPWAVEAAAWLAGFVYGFASPKWFFAALGQFNIASSQWVPFCILYLVRAFQRPRRWREWALAALFLAFQAWAELTYASFLALFAAAYALGWAAVRLWHRRPRALLRPLPGLALLAVLTLLAVSPILAAMLPDMLAEGDFLVEGSGFAETFSADLLGFALPTQLHPLWGQQVAARWAFPKDKGQHLYLGYAALALALAGLALRRERRQVFFALALLTFGILALGPRAHWNGQVVGPTLPFALLQEVPFFKGNRYPGRFGVVVLLCLAVLAAYGAAEVLSRLARRPRRRAAVAAFLALLMALEYLSIPLPLSDLRVPPAYQTVQGSPGEEWAVLDLPLAWRNGFRIFGILDPVFMYAQFYQTAHHGRLLSGNTSRNPELKFQYFVEAPILRSLLALENGHPLPQEIWHADAEAAPRVLDFLRVRYVVVHKDKASSDLQRYVTEVLPVEPLHEDAAHAVYAVEAGDWEPTVVGFGDPGDRLYLAEGWSGTSTFQGETVVWAQRRRTRLLIPGEGASLRLVARCYAPGEGQAVELVWEGHRLGTRALSPGWNEVQWEVPQRLVQRGVHRAELRWARLYPPRAVPAGEEVGGTGVPAPVHLYVRSAGLEVGWFAHLYVNGQDISPGGRGYNLAVVDPTTGDVRQVASFDTHGDAEASPALAAFLETIPEGMLVLGAVNDEASLRLTEEAVAALRSVGAQVDLQGKFRWGHAFVGVKGAAPGQALEGADLLQPVSLAVGQALTEPHVAGALDWLRVE
ncbi:MAG: hypothetical protein H5T59_01660 [Anaerolineae bacterium]|nr:hypothetical protein [Anaerolineae bacterium]